MGSQRWSVKVAVLLVFANLHQYPTTLTKRYTYPLRYQNGTQLLMSFIRVHKNTTSQQNQYNTLKYLIDQKTIDSKAKDRCFEINSNKPSSELLKSIGDQKDRVLIKLKDGYYYGMINNSQATDESGVFIFQNGAYFQGNIKNSVFQGKGKLIQLGLDFKEKVSEYDGEWKNGRPHGKGYEFIQNSITYKGQFKEGKKDGKGVMTYKDNSVYQGEFKNNQVQGYGSFKTQAHKWTGNWKEGYLEGQGVQISFGAKEDEDESSIAGESVYKGGFLKGLKNGVGTYTWGNNFSEYTGHFTNGQLDGEGRLKIGQAQYVGEWKKGFQVALDPASRIQFKKIQTKQKAKVLTINTDNQ